VNGLARSAKRKGFAEANPPYRTCVGCRLALPQAQMVRFVRTGLGWKADAPGRRQPGRGAYLCSAECATKAAKNRRYPGLATAAEEYGLISSSNNAEK